MGKFQVSTKEHLAKYKKDNFKLNDGCWKKNNKTYPHLFCVEDIKFNYLEGYREEIKKYIDNNKIKLHSDAHHLNSSQVMCFNFFIPLIIEKKLEQILKYVGIDDLINYSSICFEKDGFEAEFGRVPTSFDFYFETSNKKKIYFEIKYTESEFGKTKINKSKFESVYNKRINILNKKYQTLEMFFNNYQIFRNLVHINQDSYVFFLLPKDNKKIFNQAQQVKSEFLDLKYHNKFSILEWKDINSYLLSNNLGNQRISSHLTDFNTKYLSY